MSPYSPKRSSFELNDKPFSTAKPLSNLSPGGRGFGREDSEIFLIEKSFNYS